VRGVAMTPRPPRAAAEAGGLAASLQPNRRTSGTSRCPASCFIGRWESPVEDASYAGLDGRAFLPTNKFGGVRTDSAEGAIGRSDGVSHMTICELVRPITDLAHAVIACGIWIFDQLLRRPNGDACASSPRLAPRLPKRQLTRHQGALGSNVDGYADPAADQAV
jgi:hypothetical protein